MWLLSQQRSKERLSFSKQIFIFVYHGNKKWQGSRSLPAAEWQCDESVFPNQLREGHTKKSQFCFQLKFLRSGVIITTWNAAFALSISLSEFKKVSYVFIGIAFICPIALCWDLLWNTNRDNACPASRQMFWKKTIYEILISSSFV